MAASGPTAVCSSRPGRGRRPRRPAPERASRTPTAIAPSTAERGRPACRSRPARRRRERHPRRSDDGDGCFDGAHERQRAAGSTGPRLRMTISELVYEAAALTSPCSTERSWRTSSEASMPRPAISWSIACIWLATARPRARRRTAVARPRRRRGPAGRRGRQHVVRPPRIDLHEHRASDPLRLDRRAGDPRSEEGRGDDDSDEAEHDHEHDGVDRRVSNSPSCSPTNVAASVAAAWETESENTRRARPRSARRRGGPQHRTLAAQGADGNSPARPSVPVRRAWPGR